ncbi:MAG: carboxypeptidase-like regulatory domain-containing protein [Chitinophagaceae bacterium]
MKKTFAFILLLFAVLYTGKSFAQDKPVTITGKVTSFEESLPLEGVSIQVKGSNNNTGTQADGTFSISLSPVKENTLVINLAGYEKIEVIVTQARQYDIVLKRKN